LRRKTLLHEPLEERQLLAVDSGLGAMSPMSPLWENSYLLRNCRDYTAYNSALVPNDIAKLETDAATASASRVYGPLTWEQWVSTITTSSMQTTSSSSGCNFSITAVNSGVLEHENYLDFSVQCSVIDPLVTYRTFSIELESTNPDKIYQLSIYNQREEDSPLVWSKTTSLSSGESTVAFYYYHIHMTPVFIPYDPDYQVLLRIYGNDAIPNEPDEIITLTVTELYLGTGSVSASATILEDDNWIIGSRVVNDLICEPAFASAIKSAGGTAINQGVIRIEKTPGDENCTDNTYPITVEFVFNDSSLYDLNDPNVAYATSKGNSRDFNVQGTGVTYDHDTGEGTAIIPAGAKHVDVTIVARDDAPDNNERVYLNITDAYAVKNHPFKFTSYTEDYMLIKDAGWWIESVEWVANPYGNPLIGTWTGRSVYADRDTPPDPNDPNNMDHRLVNVVVTVGGLLPNQNDGGGKVYLECFDPPNASGTEAANNDGINIFYGTSNGYLTFYGDYDYNYDGDNNKMTQSVLATVGINAGDNYIIEATALDNNDNPINTVESEILTVWRRLWMELDQMEMPDPLNPAHDFPPAMEGIQWSYPNAIPNPEPNDFDVLFQPPKPDISLLTSAMVAACVSVKEIQQDIAHDSWRTNDLNNQWDTIVPFVHNMEEEDFISFSQSCRDVRVISTAFWCIHAIGAYEGPTGKDGDNVGGANIYERGSSKTNVFYIYNETIRDFSQKLGTQGIGEMNDRKAIVLHETLHCFGIKDLTGGIMDQGYPIIAYGINWQTLLPFHITEIQKTSIPYGGSGGN